MTDQLRKTIIGFLVLMGVVLYVFVFLVSIGLINAPLNDATVQFAMTIGVSVSAFIGAWLGIDTKRRLDRRNPDETRVQVVKKAMEQWHYRLQFIVIIIYLISLLVGTVYFMLGNSDSIFIQSIFTTTTGLMLGALAVVLSPID